MSIDFNKEELKNFRQKLRNNPTPFEKNLWFYFKCKQFYGLKWRRQYSVGDFIIDFYCPELRIGIEIDGNSHSFQIDYDKKRTEYIKNFGIEILRYTNIEIKNNIEGVLEDLRIKLVPLLTSPNLGEGK